MQRVFPMVAILAGLVVLAVFGEAAVLLPLSLEQMVVRAPYIVQFKVKEINYEVIENKPFTLATCEVIKTLKGDSAATVELRLPGGQMGEMEMVVPGAPIVKSGESYVAFLEPDTPPLPRKPAWHPLGLGQGMFALVEKEGRTFAIQTLNQAPIIFAACTNDANQCLNALRSQGYELADLLQRIK